MRSRHKYKAKPSHEDGIRFDSKLERNYYNYLKKRQSQGFIIFFLRQVPIHLPGNTKYVCDFVEFHEDGTCHFVDCKGVETQTFKLKKRQVEELYPIEIEILKAVPEINLFTNREIEQ